MIICIAGSLLPPDGGKFERIYLQYGKLMHYKANEILHDYTLSEDAVSEAFIRIYKNLQKLDDAVPSGRTAAFVVMVVRNVALTMVRKQKYTEILPLEDDLPDAYSIEERVVSDLAAEEILEVVDGIGDELKHVFILHYAYDMSLKEIASVLGITANAAAVRLHRAKKKLAGKLFQEGMV